MVVLDGFGISQVEKTFEDDLVIVKIKTRGLSTADGLQDFIGQYDLALTITLPKNASTTPNPVSAEMTESQVKGRSRGQIEGLLEQPLNLKAHIKGEAYCIGQGENPCSTLSVVMD